MQTDRQTQHNHYVARDWPYIVSAIKAKVYNFNRVFDSISGNTVEIVVRWLN